LSWGGFFTTFDTVPPRLGIILIPALTWLVFLATTTQIKPLLETMSLKSLTYVQTFRIFMELILWLLIAAKAMAPGMTFTI
jgi:hypothetical protein